ncbi:class I SAM-dependent methyltransferase [Roseimaritima ulvae]|uniref:Demethylrebeccamycin-D-glucose O-methyltransferase n=1 Tax=Roseimaritima ulvae TaxID=980254 RepID=A0A5B9QXH6_9BACT|nr:class I SAM-dependent methyltransferase [Roseimaritima ulvae]QEG38663.1 Demethylrebeccamycin-D-glucose O-methyltransferase [Roseimaritima ulvae]
MSESTLKQGEHDQIGVYERTGAIYEEYRYGSKYRKGYFNIRSEALARLLDTQASGGAMSVVEIGCGTGITLEYLSRTSPNLQLHGIDISQEMLEQAEARFADAKSAPELKLGSVFELPYEDDSFDALYATRFIHQFTQAEKLLIYREFERIVRPGGSIIVEFYGNRFHQEKKEAGRYREKFPDKQDVDEVIGGDYQVIPVSFRGGMRIGEWFGELPLRVILKTLRALRFHRAINEYFAVSRSPAGEKS